MQRSRRAILEFLKRHGRATLDQLARELGVVPMTVRAHLSILERDGLVRYEEERGKIGRPRFVYSLTPQGQEQFPKSYDALCNRILDVVTASPAEFKPAELAERVAETWAREHVDEVDGKSLEEKVCALAAIRTEEGAMASWRRVADGYLLEQCHCPASCVALRHPEIICAAEMGYIRRLLGVSVERASWKVEGGATCSYLIRPPTDLPEIDPPPA